MSTCRQHRFAGSTQPFVPAGPPCVPAPGDTDLLCVPALLALRWNLQCQPLQPVLALQIGWLGCPRAVPAITTGRSRCRCWLGCSSRTSPWVPSTLWRYPPREMSTPGAATPKARYILLCSCPLGRRELCFSFPQDDHVLGIFHYFLVLCLPFYGNTLRKHSKLATQITLA